MQNISSSPVASSQSSAESFKAIADQFNAVISKDEDAALKRMQLHQFILSCVHLKSGLEKRLAERKICKQKVSEVVSLPSVLPSLLTAEKEAPLKVNLFFGAKTVQIEAVQGKEEIKLLLTGSILTVIFSSLPIDAEWMEQILKALPEDHLKAIEMIENKSPFRLTAQAVVSFLKFCPSSRSNWTLIGKKYPYLINVRLIKGDQSLYLCQEIATFIWPELGLLLQKLAPQPIENDSGNQEINLAAVPLSLKDIQWGLRLMTYAPNDERIERSIQLILCKLFYYLGDIEKATASLASLQKWIFSEQTNEYAKLQAWIIALTPLQLAYPSLNEEMRRLLDSCAQVLNNYCDRYIYEQLITFPPQKDPRQVNPLKVAKFQQELTEMSPFVLELGHTWNLIRDASNQLRLQFPLLPVSDDMMKMLSPLKRVKTLHFNSIEFIIMKESNTLASTQIFNILRECFVDLNRLTIVGCKFNRLATASLSKWEKLKELTFNRCLVIGSGNRVKSNYLQNLQSLPSLEKLSLISCTHLDLSSDLNWIKESQIKSLVLDINANSGNMAVGNLGQVRHLHIDASSKGSTHPDSLWLAPLFNSIQQASHLQELSLSLNGSSPFHGRMTNPNVKQLKIDFKVLSIGNIFDTVNIIVDFPNLEQLEINVDLSEDPSHTWDFIARLNRRPNFKKLIVSRETSHTFLLLGLEAHPLNFALEEKQS
ncbi:MAG: hypothetical protein K0S07_1389 [Chlamydiales bacterium]|jgi:hypothetical protein|nr:hypothetical protein [Chlamydiales bacterium]